MLRLHKCVTVETLPQAFALQPRDPPHIAPNTNNEILAAKYKASHQMQTWEKREHKAKQKQMLVCDSANKLYPH